MANIIIINYGTININEIAPNTNALDLVIDDEEVAEMSVDKAKDELLTKMYYARNKQTLGGYNAWLNLLEMYYCEEYIDMLKYIAFCKGKGGSTRRRCKNLVKRIIIGD